jgi:uncharacterized protein
MNIKNLIHKHPVSAYFILTFFVSWSGALIIVAPKLFSDQPVPYFDGILIFPVLLTGPLLAGIILNIVVGGKQSLRDMFSRMIKFRIPFKWYLPAVIIPPLLIVTVLLILTLVVSPAFAPNFFPFGFLFGIPAGIIEEIGWTGFAFPQLLKKNGVFKSGVVLGFLWGLWHLPVINFLGAASPHGPYLFAFAISFITAMAAIRLIMCWLYVNTKSIFIVQLMHIMSTSSLVVFGANHVSPMQEALWYGVYAIFLWIIVAIIYISRSPKIIAVI